MWWSEQRNGRVSRKGVRGHYFKRRKSHFKYQFAFFSSLSSFTLSLRWPMFHCIWNLASYQNCRARSFFFRSILKCVQRRARVRMILRQWFELLLAALLSLSLIFFGRIYKIFIDANEAQKYLKNKKRTREKESEKKHTHKNEKELKERKKSWDGFKMAGVKKGV